MRRDLHNALQVPALYIATVLSEPLPVTVRIHGRFQRLGEIRNSDYFNAAEREDVSPRIIFMREQVAMPARNAVISVEAGEAYSIDRTEPADDISITAFVVRLDADEAAGLPVPEA